MVHAILADTAPRAPNADGAAVPTILRVGVAGCFFGHGAFGIITKAAWVPYFAVGGVGEPLAWQLMPVVGTMDIAIGVLALAWPCRALFAWATLWAVWTALLRPLSGESGWEFVERAGNYGVPLAVLVIVGVDGSWFARLPAPGHALTAAKRQLLAWVLRLTTATLLAGHAGLGYFVHKAGLIRHYSALGVGNPAAVVPLVGAFEFFLTALVLLRPRPAILVGICVWKLATESLFLISGAPAPVFEVIERFGSYTAPLALAALYWTRRSEPAPAPQPVSV